MNETVAERENPQAELRRVSTANALQRAQDEQIAALRKQVSLQESGIKRLQGLNSEQQGELNRLGSFVKNLNKERTLSMTFYPNKPVDIVIDGPMTIQDYRSVEKMCFRKIRGNLSENSKLKLLKMQEELKEQAAGKKAQENGAKA